MDWAYRYTPYIWPMLLSAALLSALGVYAWRRRAIFGATPFAIALLAGVFWSLAAAMQVAAIEPSAQIFWYRIQSIGALLAATTELCFALEYTHNRPLNRRSLVLLSIPVLLATTLILTDSGHHWLWLAFSLEGGDVHAVRGSLGWILTSYGFLLTLPMGLAFIGLFMRSPQHRWVAALMLCVLLITRAAFALDRVFDLNPFRPMDLTVLVWIGGAAIYGLALFGFHMFDPIPLARLTVIEQMREGMLVLDTGGKIVDLNPAVERILGLPAARGRGLDVAEVLPSGIVMEAPLDIKNAPQKEISLGTGSETRFYTLYLSSLRDRRGHALGSLLLLHDVTDEKRAQALLLEKQRAIASREEQERLARELHDELAQELSFINLQAQAACALLESGQTPQAKAAMLRLAEIARLTQLDVRELISFLISGGSVDRDFLEALRATVTGFSQKSGILVELQVPASLQMEPIGATAQVQLLRITQEALTNIRKHARTRHARVYLAVESGQVEVAIEDEGVGFEPEDLAGDGQGFGLRIMRDRVAEIGGDLEITSAPGKGTRICVQVPARDVAGPWPVSGIELRAGAVTAAVAAHGNAVQELSR